MANKGMTVFSHNGEDYLINDSNIADEFSGSKNYAKNERCYYQGKLYRFVVAHNAGVWNAAHVVQILVEDEIAAMLDGELAMNNITMTAAQVIKVADGAVKYLSSSVTGWACSDFIPIPANTKEIKTNADASGNSNRTWGNAFYDAGKNFIANSGTLEQTMSVPANAAYIRVTDAESSGVFNVYLIFRNTFGKMEDDVDYMMSGEKTDEDIAMSLNGAINTETGAVANFPGYPHWKYSGFISVPECTAYFSTNAISAGGSVGVAFYDENMQFIEGSGVPNYTHETNTFAVRKGYKFVRITDSNESDPDIYITWISNTSQTGIYAETENLADAIASEKLLTGDYVLDSPVIIKQGQTVIGSRCTVHVQDGGQIVMENESRIMGIKFVGTWEPERTDGDETHPSVHGYIPLISYQDLYDGDTDALFGEDKAPEDAVIRMYNTTAYNVIVDGCRFENIDRLCILAHGQRHQEKTNCVVCNNYFTDCRMGVYVRGEFTRMYANEYLRCIVGCTLQAGNTNNFGEIFKCCDVGYYFPIDAVAHNEITSVEAAHCGLAGMYIRNLQKIFGCVVSGCHFPDAPIIGVSVNNLYISSSLISTYLKYDSGKHNAIVCCNIRQAYQYDQTEQFQVPADTLITLNRAMDDDDDADVNWPTT